LLERFRVGTVYVSPVMFSGFGEEGTTSGAKVLHEAIERAGVPIRTIWSGDRLRVGADVSMRVLHPPERGVIGSDNANSVTVGVEYAGRRLLLPGDLESPGMEDVIAEEPYDCDILLAPHHGSRRSDPPGFAAWSRPEWDVIRGGGGDDIDTVERTYRRAGANVFATNDVGTVRFVVRSGFELDAITWHEAE
jgi:competence protein ComEC